MTNLSAEMPANGPIIRGFGAEGFRIEDQYYNGGVILTPSDAYAWDVPDTMCMDDAPLMDAMRQVQPEFLLLGTGKSLIRPSAKFTRDLEAMHIGIEVMDSRAAARAWSMLRLEERQIVGAIMPLG